MSHAKYTTTSCQLLDTKLLQEVRGDLSEAINYEHRSISLNITDKVAEHRNNRGDQYV